MFLISPPRYCVDSFMVNQLVDVPRELFMVTSVVLTHLCQRNMDVNFQTVQQCMQILAAHNASYVGDVLWGQNFSVKAAEMQRAMHEMIKTAKGKCLLSGGSRSVPTSLTVCTAYEHSVGLARTDMKLQAPMCDHYFIDCCQRQQEHSGVDILQRERLAKSTTSINFFYENSNFCYKSDLVFSGRGVEGGVGG